MTTVASYRVPDRDEAKAFIIATCRYYDVKWSSASKGDGTVVFRLEIPNEHRNHIDYILGSFRFHKSLSGRSLCLGAAGYLGAAGLFLGTAPGWMLEGDIPIAVVVLLVFPLLIGLWESEEK